MELKPEHEEELKKYLKAIGLKPITYNKHLLYFRHFRDMFGGFITQKTIDSFLTQKTSPNHKALIQHLINSLKRDNKLSQEEQLEVSRLVILKRVGRKDTSPIRVLTKAEVHRIVEKCKLSTEFNTKRFRLMVGWQFSSGLRINELCNLRWEHLNFQGRNKFYENNRDKLKYQKLYITPDISKGGKGRPFWVSTDIYLAYFDFLKEWRNTNPNIVNEIMLNKRNIWRRNKKKYSKEFKEQVFRTLGFNLPQNKSTHILRHCLKEDCQILTENGWKGYNQIKIGDKVFSLNISKDILELKPIKDIYIYDFNGNLNHIKNHYLDYSFTNEHRLPVQLWKTKIHKTIRKDYFEDLKLIKFNELISIKNLRNGIVRYKLSSKFDGNISLGKARAGILGWILTDGRIQDRGSPFISIFQSWTANREKCNYIENLLIKGKIPHSKKIRTSNGGYSKEKSQICQFNLLRGGNHGNNPEKKGKYHDWIFEFINRDRTPKWNLLNLKYNELKELHKCMMMGDGTKGQEFCNQNPKIIEFFRILSHLLGFNTQQGTKTQNGKTYLRIYLSPKFYCQLNFKKDIFKEKYKGRIWCISNDNETFIIKSNNKISLTGNSRATDLILDNKMPLQEVRDFMGHSSISITEKYLHIAEDLVSKGLENM